MVGTQNSQPLGNIRGRFLERLKIEETHGLAISPPGLDPTAQTESRVSKRYVHTHNSGRNRPAVHGGEDEPLKRGVAHTMKHHSALKRKGALAHATVGRNLEDIVLSETRQS